MLRVISIALILLLMLSPISSFAAAYSFDYTIGEQTYELSIGGYTTHEFYLPFDSEYIVIQYTATENSTIDILINNETQLSHIAESGSTTATLYFSEIVRKGNCNLEIECADASVNSIVFHKVSEMVSYSGPENITIEHRNVIKFTDYEDAIRTAVIINKNSSVIKVNGANRYVNYDNPKETPYCENGITYLPIHTFARSFGYYYEQGDNYFLLRADNVEFVLKNGKLYKQINQGEYTEIPNNVLQNNNTVYIPIEYYAGAAGKTILIKDDYIIADQRDIAKKIISDDIFSHVQEEFESFISAETENVYYVAQTSFASDSNPGTADEPFATLAKACKVADAGDRVIVGSGVYREILKPENNGTADNPIIFEAAEGAEVTISALEDIGNPDYAENGLYVYNIDWNLGEGRNQVFYKSEALAEARHPNSHTSSRYYPEQFQLSSLWPTQGNIQVTLDGVADTATSTTDLNQSDDYWKDATLVTLHGRGYGVATAKITSSESGKLYLGDTSTRIWHKEGGSDADSHYDFGYITNTINAVDVPGEWFWGNGKLYIYPFENSTADTLQLEVKKRQITVDLTDREYIHLVGINTVGGGMKLNNSEMCVINGGTHKYISHYTYTDDTETGFIDTRDSVNDLYDADAAVYRGEVGLYLGGRNNAVINTQIEYSASGALCLAGAYSYIENNLISECGYMGSGTNGIYLFSSPLEDITIVKGGHCLYNNTVDKTGRASLNLSSWTYPLDQINGLVPWVACDIAYNDFLNSNINTRDNGAVYAYGSVLGDERRKLQFHHNVTGNSWVSDGYGTGMYWDNWSQMVECYNNIVFYDNKKVDTENYLYISPSSKYPETFSYVNEWNNNNAGYLMLGKAGLSINDYPLNDWFSTGYGTVGESNTNITDALNNTILTSSDAVISSDNVKLENNGATYLNKTDEWICFEDVDFGDDCQSIGLMYFGDRYNTGDKVVITVGNYSVETTLECTASYKSNINELIVPLDNISGVNDVYIKCVEHKSAGILGIYMIENKGSVNNEYSLSITDDNDKYYIAGKGREYSSIIATITDIDGEILHSADVYDTNESGKFSFSLNKSERNGVFRLNLFSWESLDSLKPLNPESRYIYSESKFKDAFYKTKFKDAESHPGLISDGTVVSSYGENDIVCFKNVDFRNNNANVMTVKYGLDDSEFNKLTLKVFLDSTEALPILTFSPESTVERWSRQEFSYNLDTTEPPSGVHDVYFVIEGDSSLPMHLEHFSFEDAIN